MAGNQRDTPDVKGGYLSSVRAIFSLLGTRVLSSALAFLGNVLVARYLGPADFNNFYLLFGIMSIVAGLTGPAIDASLVRFAVRHISPEGDDSGPYFKFVLYLKGVISLVTMVAGVLLAAPLLALLFTHEGVPQAPLWAIVLAFLGGAVVSMWGFAQSYFQAHMRFSHYAAYEFFSSLLRLGLVVGLMLLGLRGAVMYLTAYVAAPLVMAIVSWSQLPKSLFRATTSLATGRDLLHFAKWVLAATLFTTITQRLDLLLLNLEVYAIPKETLGHYSAAVSMVLAGELVLLTFYNVLLPKASALKTSAELRGFIGQFRIPSLVFCLGLSLMIPLAGLFRLLAFGEDYQGAEVYFTILLLGVIAALACAPTTTALYSLGHSRTIAAFEAARLVLTLVAGMVLIPRYGVYGMAWAMAGVRAGVSVVTYLLAHQKVKRQMIREWQVGG